MLETIFEHIYTAKERRKKKEERTDEKVEKRHAM